MAKTSPSSLLFAGSSHPKLGEELARLLKMPLIRPEVETFPDGELGVKIEEDVCGKEVFLLQTLGRRPNHLLMELLILVDALKRSSARSITALVPYLAYTRQDRRAHGQEPITARLVADLLEKAGVTRLVTLDLHAEQIQGFFNIPLLHLRAEPLLLAAAARLKFKDPVVVAPDLGGAKRARSMAQALKCDYAVVDKRRVGGRQVEAGALLGKVEGREALIVDDMISTGETLRIAAKVLKRHGAKRIAGVATHALFEEAIFKESGLEKLIVSNTLPLPKTLPSVEVVSVAPLLARAIEEWQG